MAKLGYRRFDEMIGQRDRLEIRAAVDHWKAKGLDLSPLLHKPDAGQGVAIYNCEDQDHGLDKALDHQLIELAEPSIERCHPVKLTCRSRTRTVQ